MRQLFL